MFKSIKILLTTAMDLCQRKLTRAEWEGIEIPVDSDEKQILNMIKEGFHETSVSYSNTNSLYLYTKIEESKEMTSFLFEKYFKPKIDKLLKKNNINYKYTFKKKTNPKKKEIIRIENFEKTFEREKKNIYEFIVMDLIEIMINKYFKKERADKSKKMSTYIFYYYTIHHLNNYPIKMVNELFKEFVGFILDYFTKELDILSQIPTLIENASTVIEHNSYLWKHANICLYKHQKDIFQLFKLPEIKPKLVLYIAPTSTGKTLTPIGLCEKYRVIFVCAARHVGLAIARNAISSNRKIALAFNCGDAEDIRLHFNAAKDCIRDRKSGVIRKVDNSNGENVEMIISDIKSYRYAMYYMLAFNKKEKIITFWDEPTITMDYESHDFHEIIHNNWKDNLIPNIVLSSATLPREDEIISTIQDYRIKFGGDVHSIISHDCKKTIPIINQDCSVYLPHLSFAEYKELQACAKYINENKTLFRYLDLGEIVRFILFINTNNYMKRENLKLENYFMNFNTVTMFEIKQYYLLILKNIKHEEWSTIYKYFNENRKKYYESNIHAVTSDSYTLTHGPTIFLTENIKKVAAFYLKESNIPEKTIQILMRDIEYNTKLTNETKKLEKDYEDLDMKENKVTSERKNSGTRVNPEMKAIQSKIEELLREIRVIQIDDTYIPNTHSHTEKWIPDKDKSNLFTADISEDVVIRIAQLTDIDAAWKILLIMGIGVFSEHTSIAYTEIMKELASQQKLFMIIASSDYIYGTNYQFTHGYISKDLSSMTQEKTLQALGRIGRNKMQQEYSVRFRDSGMIHKIFTEQKDKPEVKNMNRLFS